MIWTILPPPVLFPAARATLAPALSIRMIGAEGLYQLPLLGSKPGANGQQETGIRFFQLGPRLSNLVNLSQDFGFVGLIVAHQRFQRQFGLLQAGSQINQLLAVFQQNTVKCLALHIGQLQPLYLLGIVPPAAVAVLWSKCPLHRWLAISESRSRAHAAARPLPQRHRSRQQHSRHRQSQPYRS